MTTENRAFIINSYEDVDRLVLDGVPEHLQLEYKSGQPSRKDEFKLDIAQDVSALANSAGGILIIGVAEKDGRPHRIDGVDPKYFGREALGQVLTSRINPPIPGLRVESFRGGENNQTVLVVFVPSSSEAPHQGPNQKYYRRYDHHSQAMEHHEIEDVRRRQLGVSPLVVVSAAIRGAVLTAVDIRNPGLYPARNIVFELSSMRLWPKEDIPAPIKNGMAWLGPGQHMRFAAQPFSKVLDNANDPATFEVKVEYTHGRLQQRMSHIWPLNFEAYRGSLSVMTDEHQERRDTLAQIKAIAQSIDRLTRCFEKAIPRLTGTNGLDLSVYTLRNLENIFVGRPIEKISPAWLTAIGFQSALGITSELANSLESLFRGDQSVDPQKLADLPGMNEEILTRFKQTFQLPPDA